MTVLDSIKSMPSEKLAPLVLACALVIGFFAIIGVLAFHAVPPVSRDALMILLGVLGKSFGDVISYFFGSSAASKAKDETIKALGAQQ